MMKNKQKNLIMIVIAAAILVGVNVGVYMAANNGAITPIDNMALWGAFVALNVASILWAISLLGLQPFVVALSYVAGGFLAFQGVRGMGEISVAEVTTAGATYGAFGALAIGNATAKVRLAFFKKGQVPFVFIIVGLLVVDAGLNSGISGASGSVLLNAVAIPFAVAGVVVGAIWSVLNRFGIGRKPSEVLAAAAEERSVARAEAQETAVADKLVIPMPAHAMMVEEPEEAVEIAQPVAPAAILREKVVVEVAKPKAPKKEEEFFPLEIDKGEAAELPEESIDLVQAVPRFDEKNESFEMPSFDSKLYDSGYLDATPEGGVLVKESVSAVVLDRETVKEKPAVVIEKAPVETAKPEAKAVPVGKPTAAKNDDWLGGHLDLLNKLK